MNIYYYTDTLVLYSNLALKNNVRTLIAKLSLRLALNAVGLRKTRLPSFVQAAGYTPEKNRISAIHVAIGKKRMELHEYTTDFRESPHITRRFNSLAELVHSLVTQRIDWACTEYMATQHRDMMDKFRAGDYQEFFEVREGYERVLSDRLDAYLGGYVFALLASLSTL